MPQSVTFVGTKLRFRLKDFGDILKNPECRRRHHALKSLPHRDGHLCNTDGKRVTQFKIQRKSSIFTGIFNTKRWCLMYNFSKKDLSE
jgi:hypothetical protein